MLPGTASSLSQTRQSMAAPSESAMKPTPSRASTDRPPSTAKAIRSPASTDATVQPRSRRAAGNEATAREPVPP
jgi:hypothetical protein